MYEPSHSDDYMAYQQTLSYEEGFQRAAGDLDGELPDEARAEPNWFDGVVGEEVAEGATPAAVYRHPRISDYLDLENGRYVYTITCDDGQDEAVRATIQKLNKKLAKWGQEITIRSTESVERTVWRNRFTGMRLPDPRSEPERAKWEANGYRFTYHDILLTIESPAVAGKKTKLIGSFELAEDGESVYRYALNGATEADIEPFLARWKDCDHCGFKRDRRASFICETEDGERMVIGRQCSRDFLGLDAAELLARDAVHKALTSGDADEDSLSGWGGGSYLYMQALAERAYVVAKRLGGYSKDTSDTFRDHVAALEGAKDFGRSTHYRDLRREYAEWLVKAQPGPLDLVALANYADTASGPFGENLRVAFGCEYVKIKRRNLIIAGVGIFVGRLLDAEKAAKPDRLPAKHLDAPAGKRTTFIGTVDKTIPMQSDYGIKTLILITAEDGSSCKHFCTGEVKPQAGRRYAITATVKAHETYRATGAPQTIITRAVYNDAPTA